MFNVTQGSKQMLSSVEPEVWLRKIRMRDEIGLSKTVTENNSKYRERTREQMHEVTQSSL